MQPEALTLVIPSYRRGRKILPTLRSVFEQTRRPDEVIVVNDGGHEETSEVVSQHFPSVRILNVEHGGAPTARNRGAHAAQHPYLMLLDDDDTLKPDAVQVLCSLLGTFPTACAAFADHTFTNLVTGEHVSNHHYTLDNFDRLMKVKPVQRVGNARLYDRRLYRAMLHGNLLQQPWMIAKSVYLALGGYHDGLGSADDWDLYLRLTRDYPVAQCDAVISDHYLEVGRTHLTLAPRQLETQMEAIRRQLASAPLSEIHTNVTLRRRLGMYYKVIGDNAQRANLRQAWNSYVRSFLEWPFDSAVVARLFLWPVNPRFFEPRPKQ